MYERKDCFMTFLTYHLTHTRQMLATSWGKPENALVSQQMSYTVNIIEYVNATTNDPYMKLFADFR